MRFDLTVNEFTRDLLLYGDLVVYGEQFWRPYVHVRDAARAFLTMLEASPDTVSGEVYNVGSSAENYRKLDIVELLRSGSRTPRSASCRRTRILATTVSASTRSRPHSASARAGSCPTASTKSHVSYRAA